VKRVSIFFSIVSVLILAGLVVAALNLQSLSDWWFLRSYQPTSEIAALAERSSLNAAGTNLFYVSDPEVNEAEAFNQNCPFRERSYVLGCFADRRIYIFDVTDERLDGVKEVTVAHEMLHVVYSRLDAGQEIALRKLLDAQLTKITNQRILDLVQQYRTQDPSSIYNEMHSIFGTEVAELSPELDAHYAQYFIDRTQVVKLSQAYESVFTELRDQADDLLAEINRLKDSLPATEAKISDLKTVINTIEAQLDAFDADINQAREDNDGAAELIAVNQYNSLLGQFRSTIDEHNGLVESYNSTVESINQQVKTYNSLVAEQAELLDSIDSKQQELWSFWIPQYTKPQ